MKTKNRINIFAHSYSSALYNVTKNNGIKKGFKKRAVFFTAQKENCKEKSNLLTLLNCTEVDTPQQGAVLITLTSCFRATGIHVIQSKVKKQGISPSRRIISSFWPRDEFFLKQDRQPAELTNARRMWLIFDSLFIYLFIGLVPFTLACELFHTAVSDYRAFLFVLIKIKLTFKVQR